MTAAVAPDVRDSIWQLHPTRTLLAMYAFLAPLGNLARFSDVESAFGLTTGVLVIAVVINFLPSLHALRHNRVLFSLGTLAAWMAVATPLAPNIPAAVAQLTSLVLYVLFACAAYRVTWTVKRIHRLLMAYVIGAMVSSTLTLIDFFGIVDVPRVNESTFYTKTEFGAVLQASGPFPRRSAMAAYFALVIPITVLMYLHVKPLSRRSKVTLVVGGVASSISLLLTHNRAGLLGALAAIALITLATAKSPARIAKYVIGGFIAFIVVVGALKIYFPKQLLAYETILRVAEVATKDRTEILQSDEIRLTLFEHAIRSMRTNPIGNGFSRISGLAGNPDADPHNMVTQIVWATGVFGIGWMMYFAFALAKRIRKAFRADSLRQPYWRYAVVITGSLLGWFLCGMMHQILGIGVAWMLLGVLLKMTVATFPPAPAVPHPDRS